MPDRIQDSVVVPPDAGQVLRGKLGVGGDRPVRIAFVAGPGDVVGTFDHWSAGRFDPRTPVIAYSAMFYSLVLALGAEAVVICDQDAAPQRHDPRFAFRHLARRRGRSGIGFRIDTLDYTRRLLAELRGAAPDVILIGTDAPGMALALAPASARIVLTAHNTFWPMGRRDGSVKARLRLGATARALRRISAAVCTSAECARQIGALRGSDAGLFVEIPQVLDAFTVPVRTRDNARKLLFLGRIEAEKGVFDLLSAFDALAMRHPDLTLDIAGTGSADAALRAGIAASPQADRLRFHGQLSANGVHALLESSDLLICPTRTSFAEGLALVVLEAAAHGVPALVSSVVPAQDVLPQACAVFPADDVAALTQGLARIVADDAAFRTLHHAATDGRGMFLDRSLSWGSQLYRALVH